MNERQKYLFDLQGYLVIEDVLSEADCDLAIAKIKERARPMEKTPDGYDANGTWHSAAGLYEAGEPFLKLICRRGTQGNRQVQLDEVFPVFGNCLTKSFDNAPFVTAFCQSVKHM